MRRLLNFLGVIALGGLVFALAPSTSAIAGKAKTTNTSSSCGGSTGNTTANPNCDCMPLTTFTASGSGSAVDDLTFFQVAPTLSAAMGCYVPPAYQALYPDGLLLNDNPEVTCPSAYLGVTSGVNLSCGCVMAGGNMPSGTDVTLTGDAQHGNWKLTQLEVSYAFGDNTTDSFYIGNQNGTGPGTNGGRCFAASGFALLEANGSSPVVTFGKTAYFELQGTLCDSMPLSPSVDSEAAESQKGSFTGSFVLDPDRSDPTFANWSSTGTFVITVNDVDSVPSVYSASEFSFSGYMQNP
jgi:hypothetical protein